MQHLLSNYIKNPITAMGILIVILLSITYIKVVSTGTEGFATAPEFTWDSFKIHNKACKAAMDRCNTPFCIKSDGSGPLMDCIREYKAYATKTNGLIPSYTDADWVGFTF